MLLIAIVGLENRKEFTKLYGLEHFHISGLDVDVILHIWAVSLLNQHFI